MGYTKWSPASYSTYSDTAKTKTRSDLFAKRSKADRNASGQQINIEKVEFRESRDSEAHPKSFPIMVGFDVSGSMGMIPEQFVKIGLGTFVNELLQKKTVGDPHMLFMGIGDATQYDKAPLQVTQFETDNRICDQLTDIWLEGGGGGNHFESYDLAWAFAAYKTRTDAWDKRQQKGSLFTVGDELFPKETNVDYFNTTFGNNLPQTPTPEFLLEEARKKWNVYHITIKQGYYANQRIDSVKNSWQERLQKRSLVLSDYNYLPQLIIATIALENNVDMDEIKSWWGQDCVPILEEAFNDS